MILTNAIKSSQKSSQIYIWVLRTLFGFKLQQTTINLMFPLSMFYNLDVLRHIFEVPYLKTIYIYLLN